MVLINRSVNDRQAGRRGWRPAVWLIIFCLTAVSVAYADVRYVSTGNARMHRNAGLDTAVVGRLPLAAQVSLIGQQGIWNEVEYLGQRGWVLRYYLATSRPVERKVSILSRLKAWFSPRRKTRLSAVTTTGGVRGLSDSEMAGNAIGDEASLQRMESITLSRAEVEAFRHAAE